MHIIYIFLFILLINLIKFSFEFSFERNYIYIFFLISQNYSYTIVTQNLGLDIYLKGIDICRLRINVHARVPHPSPIAFFTKEGKKNGVGGNRYCLTSLTAPPRLWLCIRSFSEGAAQPPLASFSRSYPTLAHSRFFSPSLSFVTRRRALEL